MALRDLDTNEQRVVLECLKASVDGPFFRDDSLFGTLIGLEPKEVRAIINRWPVDDEKDEDAHHAIGNVMNNLIGYPHRCEDVWSDYISVLRNELKFIFAKWRGARPALKFKPKDIVIIQGKIAVVLDVLESSYSENVCMYVHFIHKIGTGQNHDMLEVSINRRGGIAFWKPATMADLLQAIEKHQQTCDEQLQEIVSFVTG